MFHELTSIFFWFVLIITPDGSRVVVQSDSPYKNMATCEQALVKAMTEMSPHYNVRAGTCAASDRYLAVYRK